MIFPLLSSGSATTRHCAWTGRSYRDGILLLPLPQPSDRRTPQLGRQLSAWAERYPLVLVGFGVLLYSTGPVLLQSSSVSGAVFSFWRLWIGTAVLGISAALLRLRRGQTPVTLHTGGAWRWPVVAGVFFGIHQLMFMTAVKMTSVVDVALMNALAPVITALGAWWLFRERPGSRFYAWSLLAIGGGAYLAVGASAGPAGNPVGMVLAVLNVVFFAGFFLASKRSRQHISVLPFLAGVMGTAAVVVSAWIMLTGTDVGTVTSRDLWLAFAVAAGPGAVGHFVMTWPLAFVPANIPPVMRLAQPAIAGILAWLFLGEVLTGTHVLGGVVIVIGAAGAIASKDGRNLRRQARLGDVPIPGRPLDREFGQHVSR